MSAYLCIVVYRLASRTFGERTGRLAAVMCVFMPILIQMTGLHTKEAEMIFLSIYALERMDYLIRSKRYTFWNILVPILLTGLTFGFRTIIGMCLIFAFFVFIILSPSDLVSKKGKIVTIAATVVVFLAFLFTAVGSEMEIIYKRKFSDLNFQKEKYEHYGLKHGELANSLYLAPGAFVLPLSPMVDETVDHNKMIRGSTYVKNFLGFFAMLAIVMAFRHRKWRDFSLIGAYEFSYLAIIMFSFTANSERFHEPAIPLIIVMSAYAMTHLKRKHMVLFYVYCGLLFAALIGWNRLKLSAREPDSVEPLMEKLAVSHATDAGHNLPEAYQEVEYIESNGTQWINTGIPFNANHTIYNDGNVRPNRMGQLIYGYHDQLNRLGVCLYGKSSKMSFFWIIDGWGQSYKELFFSDTGIDVTDRLQTIQNKFGFVAIQGDTTYIAYQDYNARGASGSPDSSLNWVIFKAFKINEYTKTTSGIFYEGKIWDENDRLIAHYVPCYRKADGEIGLYDLVSGTFLGNEGESTFLKGEEVGNPSETLLLPD